VSASENGDGRRRRVYITGHKNPDMDSIAAAIGYAELKSRLDDENEYVPVRLGEVNAQTAWCLERSGAGKPVFMGHVMLRVRDVMRERFPTAKHSEPVREVGLTMARGHLDIVPIVDDDERLLGVMTERALAHRYIRESRKTSTLVDAPTTVKAIVEVLDGELVAGGDQLIEGRVWVHSIDPSRSESRISAGDVVVAGNRVDAQRQSLELGAAMLVASNGVKPEQEVLDLAAERGAAIVVSPLDSYVSSRMITLAAPCRALADREPLTVEPDDLLSEVAELVKDVHYRAAVAVDPSLRPIGLVTRSDLVSPTPRRVILHHIGSIETHVPVTATFDPVGSTATLVVERFRQNGMEPSKPDDLDRPDRDRRQGPAGPQGRAARGPRTDPQRQGLPARRADGHRHHQQGDRPAGLGRRRPGGASPGRAGERGRDRPSGRDEPQEAGRAEASQRVLGRIPSPTGAATFRDERIISPVICGECCVRPGQPSFPLHEGSRGPAVSGEIRLEALELGGDLGGQRVAELGEVVLDLAELLT
jgi:CBS domain-containing protein